MIEIEVNGMPSSYLVRTLVVPLVLATLVTLVLAIWWPVEGLLVNLAATFIGTLLTVLYVDRVLGNHEKRRWAGVELFTHQRVEQFANITIGSFRTAFGIGTEVLPRAALSSGDRRAIRGAMAEMTEAVVLPSADMGIRRLDATGWKTLYLNLVTASQAGEHCLEMFGAKLDPALQSKIFEIEDQLSSIIATYQLAFDILGVPDAKLPPSLNGSVAETAQTRRALVNATSRNAIEALKKSAELLRSL